VTNNHFEKNIEKNNVNRLPISLQNFTKVKGNDNIVTHNQKDFEKIERNTTSKA
jgi:hypothetical protein